MKTLVMLLCAWVVVWAGTASAECAWVLWSTTMSYWSQAIEPAIVYPKVAVTSYAACRAQAMAERDFFVGKVARVERPQLFDSIAFLEQPQGMHWLHDGDASEAMIKFGRDEDKDKTTGQRGTLLAIRVQYQCFPDTVDPRGTKGR